MRYAACEDGVLVACFVVEMVAHIYCPRTSDRAACTCATQDLQTLCDEGEPQETHQRQLFRPTRRPGITWILPPPCCGHRRGLHTLFRWRRCREIVHGAWPAAVEPRWRWSRGCEQPGRVCRSPCHRAPAQVPCPDVAVRTCHAEPVPSPAGCVGWNGWWWWWCVPFRLGWVTAFAGDAARQQHTCAGPCTHARPDTVTHTCHHVVPQ